MTKIVDFLLITYFWAWIIFFMTVSNFKWKLLMLYSTNSLHSFWSWTCTTIHISTPQVYTKMLKKASFIWKLPIANITFEGFVSFVDWLIMSNQFLIKLKGKPTFWTFVWLEFFVKICTENICPFLNFYIRIKFSVNKNWIYSSFFNFIQIFMNRNFRFQKLIFLNFIFVKYMYFFSKAIIFKKETIYCLPSISKKSLFQWILVMGMPYL